MNVPFKRLLYVCLLAFASLAHAQKQPVIFYSDIDSGPNSGGQDNNGAIVTIYGKNFGALQGTSKVQVGGGDVARYFSWSDTKVAFQLGPLAKSGNISVLPSGLVTQAAKGVPFTVRGGNIYFVSPAGNDADSGTFDTPFLSLVRARKVMVPGDITYAMDGTIQAIDDGRGWKAALTLDHSGTAGFPIAIVAYPGAVVKVGADYGPAYGIRKCCGDYWTLAGLQITGGSISALQIGNHYRLVGNLIMCPNCDGPSGAFSASQANNTVMYGNEVTRVSTNLLAGASKQYHAVYFTTDSNHADIGWNHIHDNKSCRAIQFHSSPIGTAGTTGFNQYDLHVHDNLIHGDPCDGINFATIDPSKGTVEAYNNVIYSVGTGPDPKDGFADYACIFVPGITNTGSDGMGTLSLYNNTLYDCGGRRSTSGAAAIVRTSTSPGIVIGMMNNIVYQLSGELYVQGSGATTIRGSNNLFYGSGASVPVLGNNVTANPNFVSLSAYDFRLPVGSPAIDKGVNTNATRDINGVPRTSTKFDIGAFEYLLGW